MTLSIGSGGWSHSNIGRQVGEGVDTRYFGEGGVCGVGVGQVEGVGVRAIRK